MFVISSKRFLLTQDLSQYKQSDKGIFQNAYLHVHHHTKAARWRQGVAAGKDINARSTNTVQGFSIPDKLMKPKHLKLLE